MLWYAAHQVLLLQTHTHTHIQLCVLRVPLFLIESVSYLSLSHWRNISVGCVAPAEKIDVVRNKHDTLVEPPARLPTERSLHV